MLKPYFRGTGIYKRPHDKMLQFLKPFIFYDVGLIGNNFNENYLYHAAGIGINIYGFQFMLASRLDRDSDNWSVLFDFAGFFGRENYLPK